MGHGNALEPLAEFFTVAARSDDTLLLQGELSRCDFIGWQMDGGTLIADGAVGDYAGGAMKAGTLSVKGRAGELAACEMAGGTLTIEGDVGDFAASALPGSMDGMRGGTLVVRGNAGARFGDRMRRGTALIFGDAGDFCLSADSRTVYFSAREAGSNEPWSTNFDIYSVPVTGGAPTNLSGSNKAWDASPRMSPDGRTLAYKAMKRPGFEADRFEIQLRDPSGKVTPLAPTWDRSVDEMAWSADGKSLFVTAADMGCTRLFSIDATSGTVSTLSKDGHIDAFEETPKGFVFLKSALNSPAQLYAGKPKAPLIDVDAVNLTSVNSNLKNLTFGAYEQFSFKGWNDEVVHGYVVKPAGFVEGRTYPVAFLIHGGPQGSFGDGWSYRWNPETYAGAGYAVVMIDFHGSTGYGQAFTDAISQHWGDRPLEDLQKGWAYALKTYPFLDPNRAAALGASYGGFMVNWIAGNWAAPWQCLVTHDGVFDARSMGYTTEEQWFSEWENGANVYKEPAKYDTFNPALHAKDWTVPMLVIHSDLDYRIPVEQGIGVFTALQARHVPSQFLRFPDENHWVLKPKNSMQWHQTVFRWLDKYIGSGKP